MCGHSGGNFYRVFFIISFLFCDDVPCVGNVGAACETVIGSGKVGAGAGGA
jgi:hypothetical protein